MKTTQSPKCNSRYKKGLCAAALAAWILLTMLVLPVSAQETALLLAVEESYQLTNQQGQVDEHSSSDYLAGKTLYFPISADQVKPATSYTAIVSGSAQLVESDLESFEITCDVRQGGDWLDGSPSFVWKESATGETQVYLALALQDPCRDIEQQQLDLDITIRATGGNAVQPAAGGTYQPNNIRRITVQESVAYGTTKISTNGAWRVENDCPIIQFDSDATQAILCFENGVELEGDFSNESQVFLRVSHQDTDLQQYPDATYYLFEANRKTFRKEIAVRIPAQSIEGAGGKPQAPYLYDLDQGLDPLVMTYNAEEEAFILHTRTLGRYVVTSRPLSELEKTPASQSASRPAVSNNPMQSSAVEQQPSLTGWKLPNLSQPAK